MRNIDYYKTKEIAKVAYDDYTMWPIGFIEWLEIEHVDTISSVHGDQGCQYNTLTYEQAKAIYEAIPHEKTWDDVKDDVFSKIQGVISKHEDDSNDQNTWDIIMNESRQIMKEVVDNGLLFEFQFMCGDKTVFSDLENNVKMRLRLAYKKQQESDFSIADFSMMY